MLWIKASAELTVNGWKICMCFCKDLLRLTMKNNSKRSGEMGGEHITQMWAGITEVVYVGWFVLQAVDPDWEIKS